MTERPHLELPIPFGDNDRYWRVVGANGEPMSRCGEGLHDDTAVHANALGTLRALLHDLPPDDVTAAIDEWRDGQG